MKITINLDEWTVTEERNPVNIKLVALKGEKGDTGAVEWDDLTPEQIAQLKGDPGDDYVLTPQDKQDIADIVKEETDTGWIALGSYLDTTYVTENSSNPVRGRRIGDICFIQGQVALKSSLSSGGDVSVFSAIPEQFRPNSNDQIVRMAVAWNDGLFRFSVSPEGWCALKNLTGASEAANKSGKLDCTYFVG